MAVIERERERRYRRMFRAGFRLPKPWTPEELELLKPLGDKIRAKELTYYAACVEMCNGPLSHRGFNAIGSKLKKWVKIGRFY